MITPELRAVIVDICKNEKLLFICFYYDGEVSNEIIELWNCAITEASAHLGPECHTDEKIERLDSSKRMPLRGQYAYLRLESVIYENEIKPFEAKEFSIAYALLAVQNSLLGIVTPELRAVVVDLSKNENLVYIHFYYDGKVIKEILEDWELAIVSVHEKLGKSSKLDSGIKELSFPKKIPFRGCFAYVRQGEFV